MGGYLVDFACLYTRARHSLRHDRLGLLRLYLLEYVPFFSVQTLYTYPESFRGYKILIAARYSGADVTVVSEPPEFELGKTNKTEAFLQKFPLGKVGTL